MKLRVFALLQDKVVKPHFHNANQLNSVGLEIDHALFNRDNSIDVFLNDTQFTRLESSSFQYEVLIDDWYKFYNNQVKLNSSEREMSLMKTAQLFGVTGFDFGSMGGYYTLEEVYQKLDEMFNNYPNLITEKDSIGHTIEQRPIYSVRISDNPNINEEEPEVLYTALHHAREPESMMQMIYFMYYLLENYGADEEVTYLVDNREFYFIPVVNPDGYKYNEVTNPNGGGMWRKNKRDNNNDGVINSSDGVDLNRNYGYEWAYDNIGSSSQTSAATYRGSAPFSEPETETVRQFCKAHNFQLALNYHTYSNLLITPWGYIPEETPDSVFYRDIATDMTQYNNYTWGFSADIIYAVNGDSDDWFYGEQSEKNKIFAMTPEVGESFWPSQDRIIPLAEENIYPNLYLAWVAGGFVNTKEMIFNMDYYQAGDTGAIALVIKNKGLADVTDLRIEVSAISENIEVLTGEIMVPLVNSQAIERLDDALNFQLKDDAVAGDSAHFEIIYFSNSLLMAKEQYSFLVGQPETYYIDSLSNLDNWSFKTNVNKGWELTNTDFYSTSSSVTDSRIGNYLSNSVVTLTSIMELDLATIQKPFLRFKTKYDIELGWDYGQVLISTDSTNWEVIGGEHSKIGSGNFQPYDKLVYDGSQYEWITEIINIENYGEEKIYLRFQLNSDEYVEEDGWYIDDIEIFEYKNIIVSIEKSDKLPNEFVLEQNYPNPFNPTTTIKYTIPNVETNHSSSLQNVVLKVYDILGREVTTLVDKSQTAGNYEVAFNAAVLASGVYYYTLRNGEFVQNRKMILLR